MRTFGHADMRSIGHSVNLSFGQINRSFGRLRHRIPSPIYYRFQSPDLALILDQTRSQSEHSPSKISVVGLSVTSKSFLEPFLEPFLESFDQI